MADWEKGCGALPHAPAGRTSPCTPGTSDGRAYRTTQRLVERKSNLQASNRPYTKKPAKHQSLCETL